MKLSEAIRLGSMTKRQNYGDFYGKKTVIVRTESFPWFRFETVDTACALGAAYEAVGVRGYKYILEAGSTLSSFRGRKKTLKQDKICTAYAPPHEWTIFNETFTCPACSKLEDELNRIIPHLNDVHRWTREQIADFVESLEKQSEVVKEEKVSLSV